MTEQFEESVGHDRRTFVKRLVLGSVFAAPVISSFKMSGIEAVFGGAKQSAPFSALPNTSPTKRKDYPDSVGCVTLRANIGRTVNFTDTGGRAITIMVPNQAFFFDTTLCVYRGNLTALQDLVPSGETPVSAYSVVWTNLFNQRPDAIHPLEIDVTDPGVAQSDPIYVIDSGSPVNDGSAQTGAWDSTFTEDPHYVVTHTAASAPPSGTPATEPEARFTG